MSRVRFLADEDLKPAIVDGLLRLEPAIQFIRSRGAGLSGHSDSAVLEYAARHGLIVVSHDANTMTADAGRRIQAGAPMPGLIVIHQWMGTGAAIRWLAEIWEATEAHEWHNTIRFASRSG